MRNPTSPTVAFSPGVFAGAGRSVAPLVAVLGLAFACSESPTEATLDDLAPQFDKAGTGVCAPAEDNVHCHGDDPPPPPPPSDIMATLTDVEPVLPGEVSSDPIGLGDYAGDDVTARFKLAPQCADGPDGRTISLVGVAGLPAGELANQSTCNGGPEGGWVFFRLPDLFDITTTCGPEEATLCPFPPIPSFTFSKKKNGRVVYHATGAFAPNAQYFVQDLTSGERYEFLFQDGHVDVDLEAGTWRFTANVAHLYIGHQFVCVGADDQVNDPDDLTACDDFDLSVDITVTR